MKVLIAFLSLLFIFTSLSFGQEPEGRLMWQDYKYTLANPYEWSSTTKALTILRISSGQGDNITSNPVNMYWRNRYLLFNGLLGATVELDTIAIVATSADTAWLRSARSAPDTVYFSLLQLFGDEYVTVMDTITWTLCSDGTTEKTMFYLPADHSVKYFFKTEPDDATLRTSYPSNSYKLQALFNDSQDSTRFGLRSWWDKY